MRNALWIVFLFSLSVVAFPTNSFSCGDKFLVVGRGLRYERAHAAVHPASILIYADANSSKDLQSSLKLAGHKIQMVGDEKALWSSLKSSRYDVVLVSLNEVPLLESKIIATPSKPTVLPVIYTKTGGGDLSAAKKQYNCVLKYEKKNRDTVSVIDAVMESRSKGQPPKCNWSK